MAKAKSNFPDVLYVTVENEGEGADEYLSTHRQYDEVTLDAGKVRKVAQYKLVQVSEIESVIKIVSVEKV
jgi:hypothetical protein